ncbi:MAG: hypothetical protein ACOYKE_14530, partial [Ferruginibacter sp.]
GDLEAIEIFSELVADPGKVVMKLFAFNSEKHTWGPELCNSSVEFNKNLNGQWVSFKMPKMHIHKGDTYGFKIESHNSFVGMGEAVGSASEPPFQTGQEWKFSDLDHVGHSYSYFSLAFKVDVRA